MSISIDKVFRALKIEVRPIASLKPHPRNPRTHSPKQLRQISRSMETFGFTNPILIDQEGNIIAGHGRVEALKQLGRTEVPTICLADLTEAQRRAYILADNRLGEKAGWDRELVALELATISQLDIEFDLADTGFEPPEIDLLLGASGASGPGDAADDIPEIGRTKPPVSRLNDRWILDQHRVLCADPTMSNSFRCLLRDKLAHAVFIAPPYNVPIQGNVSGLGSIVHRELMMAARERSEAQFIAFLKTIFGHLVTHSLEGSLHFVCMDWRHAFELLSAGRASYAELKNLCVWNKDNAGMGSLYRSKHELIFVFQHGSAPHINNFELGVYGRNRSNVWDYPRVNSWREGRLEELAMHPTVKPVALVADAILDCSKRGAAVLDCFGSSGTTLIAAEKTGRRAYLMELDPLYVDVAIRRFQDTTGARAIHAETRRSFDEIEEERSSGDGLQAAEEGSNK